MWGAASPPHAVPNGRCASPPRRLPSTPLLTGLPPRFFRHWRRSAPPPRPAFEKSGGKPAGKLLLISNGICWPAAHRERRACFVCRKLVRKNRRLALKDGKQPASQGGRRARTARTKHGRGPLAPPPALVLRALRARKTPPPPRSPTAAAVPGGDAAPSVIRRLPRERRESRRGPGGPWKLPKGQMTALFRPMPRRQERSAGKGTGF